MNFVVNERSRPCKKPDNLILKKMIKQDSTLIRTLGIDSLSEAEQTAILEKVERRLEEVITRVLVENLSTDEVKEAREILKEGENIEEKMTEIAAGIPRLAEKMEDAVTDEIERLRTVLKG